MLDKLGRQGRGGGDAPVGQLLTAGDSAGRAVILDRFAWREGGREGGKEGFEMCVSSWGENVGKKGRPHPAGYKRRGGGREGGRGVYVFTLVVSAVVEGANLVNPLRALVTGNPRLLPLLERKEKGNNRGLGGGEGGGGERNECKGSNGDTSPWRVHTISVTPSLPPSLFPPTFMFFSLVSSLFFSTVPPMWISSAWVCLGVCGEECN